MTEYYDYKSRPNIVSVVCPVCSLEAAFDYAIYSIIQLKADIPYFQESNLFDYHMFKESCGDSWHCAVFYPGLHSYIAPEKLPDGPAKKSFLQNGHRPSYLNDKLGSVVCHSCGCRRKHTLSWPEEAFFAIEFKSKVLWAYNRASALELRDYIASKDRKKRDYKYSGLLKFLPTIFLDRKNRDKLVSKLDKMLANSG